MIEVEAKARISDPSKIKKIAAGLGKYKGIENKIDDYYTLENAEKYPDKSLRIRKRKGFYEINFKHKISYVKGVHAKQETEFKVSNVNDFIALITDFGYHKWLRKTKESHIYELGKHFHIEINKVGGLGWFAEVEYLCASAKGIPHARKEVLIVIEKLGISQKEVIEQGYTKLLWDKKH